MEDNTLAKMNIILLGSPGVGKGTYATELSKRLDIPHISTGDIFRKNIAEKTELGVKAKEYYDKGKLVPDELTIKMTKKELEKHKNGFLLDGFPRNISQAKALETTKIDMVLNFFADDKIIIQRLSGRRICRQCAAIFHIKNLPPKKEGICDKCGGELYHRDDDKEEAIKIRLEVYKKQTKPLIDYYKEKNLLKNIKVNEDFGTHKKLIMDRIFKVIDSFKNKMR